MNDAFKNNIIKIYGAKGKQWLIDLPTIIYHIAKKWHLTNLKPFDNLSMNYVLMGQKDTQEIVLKLSLNSESICKEKTALSALKGYGAVEILAFKDNALLLEKISPGISLKSYLPDKKQEALEIACQVAEKLFQAPLLPNLKLPTIEEKFSLLDKDWPVPNEYLTKARLIREELFSRYKLPKVLHGDLHYDNILQGGATWSVIDPHGVIGSPINEVWAFIQDIEEDSLFIANYFDFNPIDIKKSYFMHIVLLCIWTIEDNIDPKRFLELANKAHVAL